MIDEFRACLKGHVARPLEDAFDVLSALPHGAVAAVLGTLRQLGLDTLIDPKPGRFRDLGVAMIVARILAPKAKLATAHGLTTETARDTLGMMLNLGEINEDDLYGAMDRLVAEQERLERELAARHLDEHALALWDLTSLWVEGTRCDLARFGYSRDGKRGKKQMEFGLLCDRDGRPLAVEVFAGNTADPCTVRDAVARLRERFALKRVVLVGDRGMLTEARIRKEVQPAGLDWISALRAPAIRALADREVLQPSLFDETHLAQVTCPDLFPGERLIICRNPLQAAERAETREALLTATEQALHQVWQATQRTRKPLRGVTAITLHLETALTAPKMKKHFMIDVHKAGFTWQRHTQNIEAEAALDGFYVIRTNLPEQDMSASETVTAYTSLSRVEQAFRSMKTVDLKVRPIFHYRERRVRAHVLLCMLAYYVEWHMRQRLTPLLFNDAERQVLRTTDVVRSDPAKKKAATKRTTSGYPVQSFQSLMAHLATLAKLRVNPRSETAASFEMLSQPTDLQTEAFRLLGLKLS